MITEGSNEFSEHEKEIQELRNSFLYKYEPACKAFILGAEDIPTEVEIEAYREVHPQTHVIILYLRDCGEGNLD